MIYEIKLSGTVEDDGKIDLQRLALLAQSISEIAKGALQIRLLGISNERGKKTERITNALRISLSDLKKGSTILELECEPFKKTLEGLQGNVFNSEIFEKLPDQTPMSLVVASFNEALNYNEENNHLDKALLKRLKSFEKVFISSDEFVSIANQGSIAELTLSKKDFKKIQTLEESIPEPQEIIINGIVDELKYSKSRISVATDDGMVSGILGDNIEPAEVSKFWGKKLTIAGTAHYLPGGRMSFLLIEKIFEPTASDNYFSRTTKKETAEQQILRQQKKLKYANHLSEIVGEWPGDESIDEILNALD